MSDVELSDYGRAMQEADRVNALLTFTDRRPQCPATITEAAVTIDGERVGLFHTPPYTVRCADPAGHGGWHRGWDEDGRPVPFPDAS